MTTATDLIAQSINLDCIARGLYTKELHEELAMECSDDCDPGASGEYWGISEGAEWRVKLEYYPQERGYYRQATVPTNNG